MNLKPIMCQPLLYSPPLGYGYCTPLWNWRYDIGYRTPYMDKAETLADIHNAMPECWYEGDMFVFGVTGNIDAVIWE